jgi:MFS transporter, MHS family, proline/betaine transporter
VASTLRRVIIGASIGNTVEWFDFAIYGFLATFIAVNFSPAGNDTAALLNSGSLAAAIAAHCGLAVIECIYISAAVSAGVELFVTRVRYSGFAVGYNVCVALFGGTTPYIVTWLTGRTGNALAPAFYVIAAAVISLLTVFTLRETAGRPLVAA